MIQDDKNPQLQFHLAYHCLVRTALYDKVWKLKTYWSDSAWRNHVDRVGHEVMEKYYAALYSPLA